MSGRVGDAIVLLVYVALVTTLVAHQNTANDINAVGNLWTGSIKAATGGV